jgi:hypothetical protein
MSDYSNKANHWPKNKKNGKKQNNPQDKQKYSCIFVLTICDSNTAPG